MYTGKRLSHFKKAANKKIVIKISIRKKKELAMIEHVHVHVLKSI